MSFALAADQVYFYVTDPAGTPLVMTDADGTVVWRADYMPFGEESLHTNDVANNKLFVGKERDAESGLLYFGARYMDSGAGRFVSPDPVGAVDPWTGHVNENALLNPQRLNMYAYAGNNPYKFIDPDGKWMFVIEYNRNVQYGSIAIVWNGWGSTQHGIFDMKTRADSNGANAAAKSGLYDYELSTKRKKFFAAHDALLINHGGEVETESPNFKNENGASTADELFAHAGNREQASNIGKTGSEGCWAVPVVRGSDPYNRDYPKTWTYYNKFISTFKDNPSGKALLLRLF